mmetsp:Transcript_151165/g.466240  ORF Transcript_151165/g.466240 Transcript_151165/m.466240 type:complete len:266 (-) Transcript_151165:8-805(-)
MPLHAGDTLLQVRKRRCILLHGHSQGDRQVVELNFRSLLTQQALEQRGVRGEARRDGRAGLRPLSRPRRKRPEAVLPRRSICCHCSLQGRLHAPVPILLELVHKVILEIVSERGSAKAPDWSWCAVRPRHLHVLAAKVRNGRGDQVAEPHDVFLRGVVEAQVSVRLRVQVHEQAHLKPDRKEVDERNPVHLPILRVVVDDRWRGLAEERLDSLEHLFRLSQRHDDVVPWQGPPVPHRRDDRCQRLRRRCRGRILVLVGPEGGIGA